jgi:hypothetical protein
MSTTTDLLNYILLDRRFRQEIQPSLEDLTEYLKNELQETGKVYLTPLAVKGMVKRMRKLFHAPIQFSFTKNAYYYTIPGYNIMKLPAGILTDLITTLKMNLMLGTSYATLENIKYEHARTYGHAHTGSQYVPIIAKAIADKKIVTIKAKSAGGKRAWVYDVHPLLLEQVMGKWVLTGRVNNDVRLFLLEDIQGMPEITSKKADIPSVKDIEKMPITKKE